MAEDRMAWALGPEDAPAIAGFLTQLGFPTTPAQASARIGRLDPDTHTLVGERVAGEVVAFGAARLDWSLERDEQVGRIIALIVHPDHRRKGLATLLVRRLEGWARDRGATAITVTSRRKRRDAHRFYAKRGYRQVGTWFGRGL